MRLRTPVFLMLLAFEASASAHQPYESSALARLDREELEVTVITSADIARLLVGGEVTEAAAFEKLREQTKGVGPEIYEIAAGGKQLQPARLFFSSRGGEAVFSAIYPIVRPGELRFRATYLSRLPPGYGASIELLDDAGHSLGRELLFRGEGRDTFSVRAPAAVLGSVNALAEASPPPAAAAESSPAPLSPEQTGVAPTPRRRYMILAGICAGLAFVALIVRRFQRPHH